MIENNLKLRLKLADIFCDILENGMHKKFPFNNINMDVNSYNYIYRNYLKLNHSIEYPIKTEFFNAVIEKAKYIVRRDLVGDLKEFSDLYPEYSKLIITLHNLIRDSGFDLLEIENIEKQFRYKEESINVSKCIKKAFKTILDGYEYVKMGQTSGELNFKRILNENTDLLVVVDTGSWRSWLHFQIGIYKPEILIDINKIFLLDKGAFNFKTKKELDNILLNVGRLINIISETIQDKL